MSIGVNAQSISLPEIKGINSIKENNNNEVFFGDGKSQGMSSLKVKSLKDIQSVVNKATEKGGPSYRFSLDLEWSHYPNAPDVVGNGVYINGSISQSIKELKTFVGLGGSYGSFRSSTRLADSSISKSNSIERSIYFILTTCRKNDGWATSVWTIGAKRLVTNGTNKSFTWSQTSNLLFSSLWLDLTRNRSFYPKWTWVLYGQVSLDDKAASSNNGKNVNSQVWNNTLFHTETQFKILGFSLSKVIKMSALNIEPGISFTFQKQQSLVTWGGSITASLYVAGGKLLSVKGSYLITPKEKGAWNSIPRVSVYINAAHFANLVIHNL